MDAFDRFYTHFFKYNRILFRFVGHDIYSDDFKVGLLGYCMYAFLVCFIFTNLYTILYYDLFDALNAAMFMCLSLEFIAKVFSMNHRDDMVWMIKHFHDIYKVNAKTKDSKRRNVFERFGFYTEIVFKCSTIVYFSSILSYFVYPICMYLFKNEIVPIIPIYIPGINEDTVTGFVSITCYHAILWILGLVAAAAADFMFTMLVVNTPLMAMLIKMEVEQLNDALTSHKVDKLLVKSKLTNILLMHREMTEFVRTLDKTFFGICFAQIVGGAGADCIAIFVIMMFGGFYVPAYVMSLTFAFQIVSFCVLGTIIEVANDLAYDSIFTCKWYLFEQRDRQIFIFLMQNCQKPRTLSVGGYTQLNMVTCLKTFKAIYSFAMLLFTFLN